MDQPTYYAGRLLLAMPGIGDQRFERSVIALCVHDEGGALGINLGEEIEGLSLETLMASFGLKAPQARDVPVLRGGPVEPQRGFVLHSLDWGGQYLVQVADGWGLSGSLDILKAIAEGRGPSRYLVALGYAGWSAGQLEEELHGDGWFLIPGDLDRMAGLLAENRRNAAFAACGVDPAHLVAGTGSA